jgi:hypothetical protein
MDIPVNYFFELVNIFFAAVFLMYVRKRFSLGDSEFLLLFAHLAVIFLTNYLLFSPAYMGDQFLYLFSAQHFRGMDVPFFADSFRVVASSYFFAYFPLPLINSVYSIAIINFILYAVLYLFYRERGVLAGSNRTFYLLYPSLALYSSLALRDTLIFFLMGLFLYYLFVRKMIVRPTLFFGIPLFILKYQNAAVIFVILVVYVLISRHFRPWLKVAIVLGCAAGFYLFSGMLTLDNLNKIRLLFYLENNPSFLGFRPFTSWVDAASYGFSSFFSFLMEPLPWSAKNLFQLIQSFENIVVAFILVKLFFKPGRRDFRVELFSVVLFFMIGMLIYSIVIINVGTAARYRYPFIALFFLFFHYFKTAPEEGAEPASIASGRGGRALLALAPQDQPGLS